MAAWIYIVRCADGTLYTGVARNIQQRLKIHNSGKGAKYTRARLPVKLVYQRRCTNLREAQRYEAFVKKLSRLQKEELIAKRKKLTRHHLLQTVKNKRAQTHNV